MRVAIWIIFAVLAAVWSGVAWMTVAGLEWAGELIASGGALDLAAALSRWSLPSWLVAALDLSWLQSVQLFAVDVAEGLRDSWPAIGGAFSRLGPLVWAIWGIGMAWLLLLTGVGHWVASRRAGATPPPPA